MNPSLQGPGIASCNLGVLGSVVLVEQATGFKLSISPILLSTGIFSTSWKILLSKISGLGMSSISSGSSLEMDDTYIWPHWILFSSCSGINLTLQIHLLPLEVENGTYPVVIRPWVYLSHSSPVCQFISGLYTRWISRS